MMKKQLSSLPAGNLLKVCMEHLSAEIQSYRNIILCCQPQSVELPDKSRFIMLANELPLFLWVWNLQDEALFHWWLRVIWRVGRKQHCTHSQSLIMWAAGWHQLHRHSRHFTGITSQWTPISVWPLTAQRDWKERVRKTVRHRQRVKDVFAAMWGKIAEINMKAEQTRSTASVCNSIHTTAQDARAYLSSKKNGKSAYETFIF